MKEVVFGTMKERMIVIEECAGSKTVTVHVRGGNKMVVDEAHRSLHDAMCVTRNLIKDNRIVYGGGSSEISCAIAVSAYADTVDSIEQYVILCNGMVILDWIWCLYACVTYVLYVRCRHAIRAYADALEDTPMALAENSGVDGIEAVSKIRSAQLSTGNSFLGVDAMGSGTNGTCMIVQVPKVHV